MKTNKIFIALIALAFASCTDWLDVTPKDKILEQAQFESEENINSALNGLYRQMTGENLYGGQLSQTTLEFMAHCYTYPPTQPNAEDPSYTFYQLGNHNYTWEGTRSKFANIWKDGYTTLLNINNFIKGVDESTAVMPQANKEILLGEAYGMRAYIHFDLFRLYGPIYKDRTNQKVLPYNDKASVTLNHTDYEETEYSTAEEYIKLVLKDITTAETLLKENDPIVKDLRSITDTLYDDTFYRNRNRRMNYYAVKALEARVQQYIGDDTKAVEAAKIITAQVGSGKIFRWTESSSIINNQNYILFSEVIFGINNLDMSARAKSYYQATDQRTAYVVDYNNLFDNIYGEYNGNAVMDSRAIQWRTSNVNTSPGYSIYGTYISSKYTTSSTKIPAITNLQVLTRISEMYYIQVEAALKAGDKPTAVRLLNEILDVRAVPANDQYRPSATDSDEEIRAHIEREYYREFFGEGQLFFFHKRGTSTRLFNGYGAGSTPVTDPAATYIIPIPDEEKNV
jgi:hypothetical protein